MTDCGITNLGSCLPEMMYNYFLTILNSPLAPLLGFIKSLLVEPVKIDIFLSLWAIMVYVISMFYGLLFLYSGFNFIISGYDIAKRENAKEWLKNIFIMIVMVQASFFLYGLVVELGSLLTTSVVGLIDTKFFMLTADNLPNIGLEFFFTLGYVATLIITSMLLILRYIIVLGGVVIAPIGLFLYFIPPLKEYGKLILNFIGICIFITFLDAIILLICSKVLDIALFQNFKILVMITAFTIVNFVLFYFMLFSALKSAFKVGGETTAIITKVGKYLV